MAASRFSRRDTSDAGRSEQDSMEEALRPLDDHEDYGIHVSGWRQCCLVAILLLGLLFSSLDASIVSTALVSIAVDLQDFVDVPWVALAYLLAYFSFAVGIAKLSDIFGRQAILTLSWIFFTAASLGCGLSKNVVQLVVFRVFQGIGGSGLYSLAQIGLFEIGPRHKPSLLGAMVGATLAISFVLGPILGGVISGLTTWRWIFYINIPIGVSAVLVLSFAWPRATKQLPDTWSAFKRFDFVGNFLIIAASTLLVYSLQTAGTFTFAWDSPVIIVALTVAAASWLVFLVWELFLGVNARSSIQPIFPLRLVTQRAYLATLILTLFTGFCYLAIIIILPERFQIVNGDSALISGVHLLPMLGATAFGSFLAGALSSKRNNTSITLIVASCFQLLGVGLLSTLSDATTDIQAQYGYQTIFGLGVGLSFGASTIMTSVRCDHSILAVAQGAVAQCRVFGGAVGIAVCSIVFNTQVQSQLSGKLDQDEITALHHSPAISYYLPEQEAALVRQVYASAFTDNIKVMIGISALGLIASLFTYERNPPPMPSRNTPRDDKEVLVTPQERQAWHEIELGDVASVRSHH